MSFHFKNSHTLRQSVSEYERLNLMRRITVAIDEEVYKCLVAYGRKNYLCNSKGDINLSLALTHLVKTTLQDKKEGKRNV